MCMHLLPKLKQIKKKTQAITNFKGLNERASIADNEFSDCCNITLSEYPALSVRDGREIYVEQQSGVNMWAKSVCKNMLVCDGSDIYYSFYDNTYGVYGAGNSLRTEKLPNADFIGVTLYNNQLFFLSKPDEDGSFTLTNYFYRGLVSGEESIDIPDTKIFDEYNEGENCHVGFMALGNRLIISYKNEIAISYHDDVSDWTTYQVEGVATASCAQRIHLMDDGYFTGCIKYRDYPIFFKENSMYILYGEYAPFSLSRIDMVGCPYPETIAVCNGALYFLSDIGVMEYTGGTPTLISENINLSPSSYIIQPSACADDRYYYISNYVFDTFTRTWAKTDPQQSSHSGTVSYETLISPQCCFEGHTYFLVSERRQEEGDAATYSYSIERTSPTSDADWSFTTKQFHEYQEGRKIISKIMIGFENESASELKIEVSLNKQDFQTAYIWDGMNDFVQQVPIILPPCDYFQLRVSGKGKMIIHYLKREYRVLGV